MQTYDLNREQLVAIIEQLAIASERQEVLLLQAREALLAIIENRRKYHHIVKVLGEAEAGYKLMKTIMAIGRDIEKHIGSNE